MKALKLEWMKSRGRGLAPIVLAMTGVSLLWILWAFRNPDADDLQWGWMQLFYNLPLLRAIVFPTIVAVIASKLADLEHKSGCLRNLETIQQPAALYRAKFACGSLLIAAATLLELAAVLLIGQFYGFQGKPDMALLGLTLLFELGAGLEMFSLSLSLSMNLRNQAVPLCIGVGGSFAGLMLTLLPKNILHWLLPWAHPSALALIGMDWSKEGGFVGMYRLTPNWSVFGVAIFFVAVTCLVGQRKFERMEV